MPRHFKKEYYANYINSKIERLTILDVFLDFVGTKGLKTAYARCLCECGQVTIITLNSLKNKHTTSCGCRGQETRYKKDSSLRKILNDFSADTPESCYWAGFIFGDGSISKNGILQVGLSVHTKNTPDHLKKMSNFIYGQDYRLFYKDLCVLQVCNSNVVKNLTRFGIIPNKTYKSHLVLPQKHHSDFIRGYIDADGWFIHKKQYNQKYNKFYENYQLGLCSYLVKNLELVQSKLPVTSYLSKKKTQQLYELRIYNRLDLLKTVEYLYTNNTNITYDRKWEKICQFHQTYSHLLHKTD